MTTAARPLPAAPSDEAMAMALRLAEVIDTMRPGSLFELDCFLRGAEQGMGGQILISLSSNRAKSGNAEAQYVSEKIKLQGI